MYAIIFDVGAECHEKYYDVYNDVRNFLEANGFTWQQGNVYFGNSEKINAASCILVVQKLLKRYVWFTSCVRNIRMLRIEENIDLTSII